MRELNALFTRLKKTRWNVSLPQALLGANVDYLRYRFRYLILNNILATSLHLFEFYLLGLYFNSQQFFSLILLRAFTLVIKNTWWGALEGLREQVRRYTACNRRKRIPKEVSCWFYSAAILAIAIFILGLLGLMQLFPHSQNNAHERFMFYGLAMLIQLAADMLTRVIHSGIFATQRVYRPWWSIPLAEVLGFSTIMILMPIARPWCLPASYIVFSFTALYMTWHYARQAYRQRSQSILIKISWKEFCFWWQHLPLSNILLAGVSSAAMNLEGIILWLLQPLIKTDPLLFKLVYLLSPQISAGFDWARMCYFDLKKLQAPKWAIFLPRFCRYLWGFSAVMGVIFWLMGCITTLFFLPEISTLTLLCFLPLFLGRSFLAFCQIRLFTSNDFLTIILGTGFMVIAIMMGNFFTPENALWLVSIATGAAIALSMRPHFKARAIFPIINLTPLYKNLEQLNAREKPINLIYMECNKKLTPQQQQLFLEVLSDQVGENNLSLIAGNNLLAFPPNVDALNNIKTLAQGKVSYFQESGWQENGREALQKSYCLTKRLFNFNETFTSCTFLELKRQFLEEFPNGLIVNLTKPFYKHFKPFLKNKHACSQLTRAISDSEFSAHPLIRTDQYVCLLLMNSTGHWAFIAKSSRESLSSIKQWQREFWQRSMEYFCADLKKQKTLLIVGRANFHKSSLVLETLIAALNAMGITIIGYESHYTSTSKAIHHELELWDQSWLSRLLKGRHRSRRFIRKVVRVLLQFKRPSRWRYFFIPGPDSIPHQAQDLRKFIHTLDQKNLIILSHSAGSILAALVADEPALKKIISFGYPFKSPDNPEESYRTDPLKGISKPLLIIQGRQDAYGGENSKTRYTLSTSISIMFTNDNHDYNGMSPEDYEVVLQRVRSFIEDPN